MEEDISKEIRKRCKGGYGFVGGGESRGYKSHSD